MHEAATIARVHDLAESGLSTSAVARRAGVARSTVRRWRRNAREREQIDRCPRCGHPLHEFRRLPKPYVYLLGMYLGDGHMTNHARGVQRLRIYLDAAYPGIARETADAVRVLHSDGCRSLNKVTAGGKHYAYWRYTFTNRSLDIQRIFCDACDLAGVPWRHMNQRTISVARKAGVAYLDEVVGPKR